MWFAEKSGKHRNRAFTNKPISQVVTSGTYLSKLQSLSIQFERYKEYFKIGPSLKDK